MIVFMNMFPKQRQSYIADYIKKKVSVRVDELSSLLEVSEITIRRDLADLEKKGILERTHGGAVSTELLKQEVLYTEKFEIHADLKASIAEEADRLVEDGDTVLVNSGSTTLQVLMRLIKRKNLTIITNNAAVMRLQDAVSAKVLVTGGELRQSSRTLVGSFAANNLRQINANKAIIGVDGLSVKSGLTSPVIEEAETTQVMLDSVQGQVILVADHSKIGRISNYKIAPLNTADTLVTDSGFNEEYRSEIEDCGIDIIISSLDSV